MTKAPRVGIGLGAAALVGWGALAACGGTVKEGGSVPQQGVAEGGSDAALAPVPDAAIVQADSCADACLGAAQDATTSAPDAAHATDGGAADGDAGVEVEAADDAAGDSGDAAPNPHERCDVFWPQPAGLTVSSSGVQLVADSSGGAYLVVTYGEPSALAPMGGPLPTLDLGVTTPGYQTAVAIVKIDAHCAISWVREIGGAVFSNGTDIANVAAGVDSQSNLTIAGSFWGSVDLGAGIVDTPADASSWSFETYVLRFDTTGNVVFRDVFRSDGPFGSLPTALAVSPSGTSTVLVMGGSDADFGDAPDAAIASNGSASVSYFVRLDAAGSVVTRSVLGVGSVGAPAPTSLSQIAADSTGTLWAEGNDVDAGGQAVKRLTPSGAVDWQQAIGSSLLAAGPGGAAVLDQSTSPAELETIHAPTDGGVPSTRTMAVSLGLLSPADQLIADTDGGVVIAGPIPGGTVEIEAGVYLSGGPDRTGYRALDPAGNLVASDVWNMTLNQLYGAAAVAADGDVLLAGHTYTPSGNTTTLFLARLGR